MNPSIKHRSRAACRALLLMACAAAPLSAATVNWGSPYFSDLATSTGETIGSDFTFELGIFENSFIPTFENVSQWAANWRIFDVAEYNESTGYFTSTVDLRTDGSSTSLEADVGVNFAGRDAYIWVYNSKAATTESEWFLARSSAWVLSTAPEEECCDDRLPLQLSVDDLGTGETPVFGGHGEASGAGIVQSPSNHTIQTYAIPEAGSLVLVLASLGLCLHRARKSDS